MPRALKFLCSIALAVGGLWPQSGRAASVTVAPGETRTLTENVVLTGSDSFEAGAAAGDRCRIEGGGFSINTADGWKGHVAIQNCDVRGLGTRTADALHLMGQAGVDVTIAGTVFDACGAIALFTLQSTTVTFTNNTVLETSLVPVELALSDSRPSFYTEGYQGSGKKLFQNNRIYRSWINFHQTAGWTIGGESAQGNIISGFRAGISIDLSTGLVVRGNYVHTQVDSSVKLKTGEGWNQVKNFTAIDCDALVVEHNVLRGGNWLVTFDGGEFRYNLLVDSFERPWVLAVSDGRARIHHNVMIRTSENLSVELDGLQVNNMATVPSTEVFNNTMDGGGNCRPPSSGAISVAGDAFLLSLRSNAFVNFPLSIGAASALVRGARDPAGKLEPRVTPSPPRLGYTDYNLFYNPNASDKINYALAVAGKRERLDAGFGLHDAPEGGAANVQIAPQLTGPFPVSFPYSDANLKNGATTVCQILKYYRGIYRPAAGSPLIDHGDPADGSGNDIGAIGAGAPHDADQFATLCGGDDIGSPDLSAESYRCTPWKNSAGGSGGAGGTAVAMPGSTPAVVCVCHMGAKSGKPPVLTLFLLGMGFAATRCRRLVRRLKG